MILSENIIFDCPLKKFITLKNNKYKINCISDIIYLEQKISKNFLI